MVMGDGSKKIGTFLTKQVAHVREKDVRHRNEGAAEIGKVGGVMTQGEVVGATCSKGVAPNPSHERGIEYGGGVKKKSGDHKLHLQGPPRDRRGLRSDVGNVERGTERGGGVTDYGNMPTRGKGWLELKIQRVGRNKAQRRDRPIEPISDGKTLQND
jgi:hypothetical protein